MICVLPAWFEPLLVFFEHFQVCSFLSFQNLPQAALRTTLWLLRKYRTDLSHGQFCTWSQYCRILHKSGKCFRPLFILNVPRPSGLVPLNTGCPEFSYSSTIWEARRSEWPPQLIAYPWYHMLPSPGPRNAQWPSLNLDAYIFIFLDVVMQESSFPFLSFFHSKSIGSPSNPSNSLKRCSTL